MYCHIRAPLSARGSRQACLPCNTPDRAEIPNWWRAHLRTAMTGPNLVALTSAAISPAICRPIPALKPARHSKRMTMVQTVQKNIRLSPEQWERIEKAAEERSTSRPISSSSSSPWRPSTAANGPAPEAEIYLLALRDVHRPGHGARHGRRRARRGDRRNRPQHLQESPRNCPKIRAKIPEPGNPAAPILWLEPNLSDGAPAPRLPCTRAFGCRIFTVGW